MKIMGFGSSLLKGIHFGERSKSRRKTNVASTTTTTTTYVCRDELDYKKKPKIKKQVKFDLEPKYIPQEDQEISHEEEKRKNSTNLEKSTVTQEEKTRVEIANHANNKGVKVKILMKKEDAARLLLKCSEGGVLEFMDIAHQLVQVPSSSVRVLSSPSHS